MNLVPVNLQSLIALIIGICWCMPAAADESSVLASAGRQEEVQSLLRLKCVKCHGPLKPKGELNLSTLRGVARGGENGAWWSLGMRR